VDVPANGNVEVRWAIAAPRVGQAKLSFRARALTESDAVEVTRRVDAPSVLETAALTGETRETAGEKLGALEGIRDDVGGLDVRLASTALVGVGDGMEQLLEYPYGCTEQLTSRLVPLVGVRDLAGAFGLPLPKDPGALADVAIAKVLANQQPDGGFGWWPDSPGSSAWVTPYALWGLDVAKKGGRPVPDEAVSAAVAWLRGALARSPSYPWMRAAQAFSVDVLATIGRPDPGFANRLYEARDQMPLFARALLAHAFAVSKMDAKQAAELLRDLEAHLRLSTASAVVRDNLGDEYAPVLDSSARTTAMVLRALVAIDAKHPLAPRLARGLLAERDRGQWRSTQEAAWALLALDDYRKVAEKDNPDFDARVWFAGDLALDAPFRGRSLAVRDAHLTATKLLASPDRALAFQVQGKGDLFYEARLRYARKELPSDTLDRGFFVRKLVRAVSPDGLSDALATLPAQSAARVPAGSLVLVDLVVVSPTPREQVVVDDPLAAGLEPVDASLATTAQRLDVAGEGGAGDAADEADGDDDAIAADRAWTRSTYHREMHDDRALTFVEHMPAGMFHYRYLARATTPGTYVVPPTKVECMYEPETFGRTAGSRLEVSAP
jgi:uncharacterized protein YfaS (alpha-2-macroglobulin family)